MKKILSDWQFYACLLLAPLTWAVVLLFKPSLIVPFEIQIDLLKWAMLIVLYPVLEEFVFRGFILQRLAIWFANRRFGLLSLANLVSSLVFAAAHLIYQPWLWAMLIFFPSLVFGYLKERHNSLISPIVMHSFYNLGFVLFLA